MAFLALVLVSSCRNGEKIPDDVIPPGKMGRILTDMHILETKISSLSLPYDSTQELFKKQQQLIFQKHQVTDSLYNKSFTFYLENVTLLDQIYGAVVDSLSLYNNINTGREDKE